MTQTHNTHDTLFGFRVFYGTPRLHQDWNEEQVHRQVTWTELFFDLFYVVASINLGHLVSKEHLWNGVVHLALYFLVFWFAWVGHTMFTTRIKIPGLLYDIWQVLYMLAVFGMVITCSDTKYHHRFAIAVTIVKWMLCGAYIVAAVTIPCTERCKAQQKPADPRECDETAQTRAERVRRFCTLVASQHFTSGSIALISAFTSLEVFYGLMIAVILVDVLWVQLHLISRTVHLPLHVNHMSERYGLIMIIFLGESIVGLGLQKPGDSAEHWLMLMFGVVVVWVLHLIYYHVNVDQHFHAMRIHRYRGMAWSFAHAALGFFFLCLGAGLRLTAESYVEGGAGGHRRRSLLGGGAAKEATSAEGGSVEAEGGEKYGGVKVEHHPELGVLDTDTAWLLCLSYALALHTFYAIRALHFFYIRPDHWWNATLVQHGLQWVAHAWWLFGFFWPFPIYFLAFAHETLHGTWLLAIIAAHGVAFIVVETFFTNFLVRHDALRISLSQALHKVVSESSMKRKSMAQRASSKHGGSQEDSVSGQVKGVVFLGDEDDRHGNGV